MNMRDAKHEAPGFKAVQRKQIKKTQHYGSQYPQKEDTVVVAIASLLTCLVFGGMVVFFILSLPGCIDELAGHSANVVAESRGVER